jgi:hypothetical protein
VRFGAVGRGVGRAPANSDALVLRNFTLIDGAYVIPGLIDTHAHVGNTVDLVQERKFHTRESVERDLTTYASYGVTTVLSMGTDQDTILSVRHDQRAAFAKAAGQGELGAAPARVYTAGQGLVFEGGYGGLAGVNDALSREASTFAYGSTPECADDPFFTRGVSATAGRQRPSILPTGGS